MQKETRLIIHGHEVREVENEKWKGTRLERGWTPAPKRSVLIRLRPLPRHLTLYALPNLPLTISKTEYWSYLPCQVGRWIKWIHLWKMPGTLYLPQHFRRGPDSRALPAHAPSPWPWGRGVLLCCSFFRHCSVSLAHGAWEENLSWFQTLLDFGQITCPK